MKRMLPWLAITTLISLLIVGCATSSKSSAQQPAPEVVSPAVAAPSSH
ncbi:MAG TPA: hypothetical protein VMV72_12685 [Verrucomicrobiae bacterium]|nr:hypothetical protein [Verrucomicrobiae bacterium]